MFDTVTQTFCNSVGSDNKLDRFAEFKFANRRNNLSLRLHRDASNAQHQARVRDFGRLGHPSLDQADDDRPFGIISDSEALGTTHTFQVINVGERDLG